MGRKVSDPHGMGGWAAIGTNLKYTFEDTLLVLNSFRINKLI